MSFEDILGGPFARKAFADDFLAKAKQRRPVTKPLPQIHGRREDGVLWVKASDVADALESQAPEVNARLIAKLRT